MSDHIHDKIEASQVRLIKDTETVAALTVLLLRDGTTVCSVGGKKAHTAGLGVPDAVVRMVMRAVNTWHAVVSGGRLGDLTPEAFEAECQRLAARYRAQYVDPTAPTNT